MQSPDACSLPDGRRLAYRTYGAPDGSPLLFHHGTPGSSVLGALLADAARGADVRVVAPSRPGYGDSDPHPSGTPATWAADAAALLDHLDVDEAGVLGFSGGGPYALAVAAERPARVRRVGVVGSPVPASDGGPFAALAGVPRVLGVVLRATELLARLRDDEAVVAQLTDRSVEPAVAHTVARDFYAALASGADGAVRETRHLEGDWRLPAPDCPVLVWHGTADENVAAGPVRAAYADRPGADLTAVDADHLGALLDVRGDAVALASPD